MITLYKGGKDISKLEGDKLIEALFDAVGALGRENESLKKKTDSMSELSGVIAALEQENENLKNFKKWALRAAWIGIILFPYILALFQRH